MLDPAKQVDEERVLIDEVTNGLVLEDNFYQVLAQFEQSPSLSVQDFFNEMLKTVSE